MSRFRQFRAQVDWGDGSDPTTATLSGAAGLFQIQAGHEFEQARPSTVAVGIYGAGNQLVALAVAQKPEEKPFGGALKLVGGKLVVPEEREVETKPGDTVKEKVLAKLRTLRDKLQLKSLQTTGVLTGDIFDKTAFEQFNGLQANENKILITINGIRTSPKEAQDLLNSVQTWNVGNRRVAVVNGTHGLGAGDVAQIVQNELGRETLADLRAAAQIEIAAQALRNSGAADPTIYVVAHSQGTEVFFRALNFLRPETIRMIEFYGNGGERFVPNDLGLKNAVNYYRDNDPVPLANRNPFRTLFYARQHKYEVWNLGLGGNGRPLTISAHGWEKNYAALYNTLGKVQLPPGAQQVQYPLRLRRGN